MVLCFVLEPCLSVVKKVIIKITVAVRAYIRVEIFEDVLSVTNLVSGDAN
jgi:hypothetical protein